MKSRLTLGTVQFGLDYGVNNLRGQIPKEEVFAILDQANEAGISVLDTAFGYGESEKVIGEYFRSKTNLFKIVSKLPKGRVSDVNGVPDKSLNNLGIKSFYGYLLHDYVSYKNDNGLWPLLLDLKKSGKAEKIGFSLYYPTELKEILDNKIPMDIVQFPYSLFDRRFESFFPELKARRIEVHVRSVYLQGLVFKPLEKIADKFDSLKRKISLLKEISRREAIGVASICLNFVLLNQFIDQVIVGVDSLSNLKETIKLSNEVEIVKRLSNVLLSLREDNEKLVLPINWQDIIAA